ncbi:unnamed protein product [Caenorhabditis angaria]|uniref:Protein kinase domain-containing protein n=1 Tax=Caenorhabditis angaria TaxID=860376 RepID=A0A9P1MZT2_9PELO|nr:unnamed protein product [Caenorhabditis angaria]
MEDDISLLDTTNASMDANLLTKASNDEIVVLNESGFDENITEKDGVPNICETGYDCIRYMGACSAGFVYLGKSRKGLRDFVAIKRFRVEEPEEYAMIAKEASNMRMLSHPNIQELESCFVYDHSIYMITPAMNLGSLKDLLSNWHMFGITEKAAVCIFGQVIDALFYIHKKRYVHRDIRPRHILIDSTGNVKLSGFRHMIELNYRLDCVFEFDTHLHNQIYYFAPELLAQNMHGYGTKSDIYMLGISLCESLNGLIPYVETEPLEMLHLKMRGRVPRPVDSTSLRDDQKIGIDISGRPKEHLERTFSPELHDFVGKTLIQDAEHRPSARELKESAWMNFKTYKLAKKADLIEELKLNAADFDLKRFEQEPIMPIPPVQTYQIAFDYSSIN